MKNSEEMVNSLLERRDQYVAEQRKKRKSIVRITSAACSFVLVALFGVGVWQSGWLDSTTPPTTDNPGISGEQQPSNDDTPDNPRKVPILWGNGNLSDNAIVEWNGKRVGLSLLTAFQDTSEEYYFAIIARLGDVDNQFAYKGKTLAEYAEEAEREQQIPEKLAQLLKEGEYLKYGEAIYQTGTPNGEKWAKELYDERVNFFGKDLLSKYIVDGVFLREKVESDIVSFSENKAQKAYEIAYDTYIEQNLESAQKRLREQNIKFERQADSDYLIIFATEEKFSTLSLDNISRWMFDFATQNHDDAQDFDNMQTNN